MGIRKPEPVVVCEVCGEKSGRLGRHILFHGLSSKEYYDKYTLKSSVPICAQCNNECMFISLKKGYSQFCSFECSRRRTFRYDYPVHYDRFDSMIQRAKTSGTDCEFVYSDFSKFVDVIGPIPEGMRSPSVSRFDHNKGYVFDHDNNRWNFRWEDKPANSRESFVRNKLHELGKDDDHVSKKVDTCPYCGETGGYVVMRRHHFDNCPHKEDYKKMQDEWYDVHSIVTPDNPNLYYVD